jgi:hypothetical protein
VIWIALAALVAARFVRYRRSPIELMYAASYFTFGVTDFIESQLVPTWLIALKAINLAAILTLRRFVLKHYYPASRTF